MAAPLFMPALQNKPVVRSLLLDVDSTLYACNPVFIKYLAQLHDVHVREEDINEWSFWRNHGLSLEQWLELIESYLHSDAEIGAAIPYPGVVETLQNWHARGVAIHVVSARHPTTAAATEAWLRTHAVPFTDVAFDMDIDKLAYARQQALDLVIDDKPSFLSECAEAGVPVATIRYAYNSSVIAANPQIIAADDWHELRRRLEGKFRFESNG